MATGFIFSIQRKPPGSKIRPIRIKQRRKYDILTGGQKGSKGKKRSKKLKNGTKTNPTLELHGLQFITARKRETHLVQRNSRHIADNTCYLAVCLEIGDLECQ
jgi:hypothetical protein